MEAIKTLLPNLVPNFDDLDQMIKMFALSGYVMALNVRGTTPQVSHVTYPDEWWEEYISNRYTLFDPVVFWGVLRTGHLRWSDILKSRTLKFVPKSTMVMDEAKKYGLIYGISFSRKSTAGKKLKSFFSAARDDREFTDEEIEILGSIFERVSMAVENVDLLTPVEIEALELTAKGMSHKEIANLLAKSPDAIKKRLENARRSLGAATTIEAVMNAYARGLIGDSNKFSKW